MRVSFATTLLTASVSTLLLGCGSSSPMSAEASSEGCGLQTRDVSLDTGSGVLYGTLSSPKSCPARAAALVIAGSGPTDRDGNELPSLDTDAYRMIATHLATKGIATVRYDKRGVAQSAAAGPNEVDLRFDNYVADARSWIESLATLEPNLPVVLLGHSEGALIGTIAAESGGVAAFASLEGPGRPLADVLRQQLSQQLSASEFATASSILDQLQAGQTVPDVPDDLWVLFRPSVQPYLISSFAYDPATEMAKLTIPVLVVQGTADLQTTTSDAEILASHAAQGTLALISGMTHTLKLADPADPQQTKAYTDPTQPLAADFVTQLDAFLTTTVGFAP